MRVPWTARRSNLSILKAISPEYSLEGLMLKLKLQYFGHLMRSADSLEKTLCWCCSHTFRETNSLRRTMQIYYTGGPKAESPLSQGPQSAFVKIFYTPCVRVRTHHPKFLETYINQGKYSPNNPSFMCYVLMCSNSQTISQ